MANVIEKCMATSQVQQQLALRLSEPFVQTGAPMKAVLENRIGKIQSVDATSPNVLPDIPLCVSLITAVSFIVLMVSRLTKPASAEDSASDDRLTEVTAAYRKTAICFLLTAALYLLALEYVPVDFRIVTAIYMFSVAALCTSLRSADLKRLLSKTYVLEMVILVPLLVFFVFQSFFSIQLP